MRGMPVTLIIVGNVIVGNLQEQETPQQETLQQETMQKLLNNFTDPEMEKLEFTR